MTKKEQFSPCMFAMYFKILREKLSDDFNNISHAPFNPVYKFCIALEILAQAQFMTELKL